MMRYLRAGSFPLLLGSIIFCLAAAIYARRVTARTAVAGGFPGPSTKIPLLIGYNLRATLMTARVAPHCALIRYTSSGCEYCRAGDSLWKSIVRQAIRTGCAVDTIVPDADVLQSSMDTHDPASPTPIVFLPFDWEAAVPLRVTPTTLMIDSQSRVIWSRQGQIDEASARDLLRILSTVGDR